MLDRHIVELTLISAAQRQGLTLNGKDLLDVSRTAKERYRQRMNAPAYQWKKPNSLRR
ncbi:hypothetical protein ACVSUB_16890 [Yersinia enterocolitica]|nr:hypothetical protein [Yersinia enterocolitica]